MKCVLVFLHEELFQSQYYKVTTLLIRHRDGINQNYKRSYNLH